MDTRTALARALALRKRDLSLEWLRQLDRGGAGSADPVFPPDAMEHQVPTLVEWIVSRRPDESAAPALSDTLRPLVRFRREQGRTPGDIVLELRMLGRILADAMVAEIQAGSKGELATDHAARLAADLGDAVLEVLGVVGSLYAEEETRAEGAASRRLDEYSRIVTHGLIDALTTADLAAQALVSIDFGADPRQREVAERVQAGVREIARAVEEVRTLALARVEEVGPPTPEPVHRVVRRAVEETRSAAGDGELRIEVVGPIPGVVVEGNRLEILLRHLLASAIEGADPGREDQTLRVRVLLEKRQLEVRCEGGGEEGTFALSMPVGSRKEVPAG